MNIIMEGVEFSQEGWSSDKKTIQGLGMKLHHTDKELKKVKKRLHRALEKIKKLNNQLEDGFYSSRYVI